MNREEVKEYLLDFQKRQLPELVERDLEIGKSRRVKSIIGPRRAGKTYFMYQRIKELNIAGVRRNNILYLNFEDPRLIDISFKEIREIVKLHWQLYPSSMKKPLHIFIDEPQNIKNWEIATRTLHDEGFNIFLTGSSSKLLSREIATSLRGRTLSYTMLPFSFKEFLRMVNTERLIDTEFNQLKLMLNSKEKSSLLNLLNEYLEFGGFPELVLEKNAENRLKMINEYFDLIVYRDIVERYRIKNTQLIKWLIKSLISSFSKEFSVHKVYLTLKSRGIRVSKNTLYSYLSMLEDSLFAFFVPKFGHSIRKGEFSINKAYLCDTAFARLTGVTKDQGRKMENMVFLELERRKQPLTRIFYFKNQLKEEVDFVVRDGTKVKQLIQVCYNIEDSDVKKRELRALLKASKELKCRNLLVITWDYEAAETVKGRRVKYLPLWKWLLEEIR